MSSLKQQINWLLRDKYHDKITPAAKKDIARLRQGEPLDYIIGWKEFLGCKIDLSLRPLVPRPETEFWVDEVIKSICHSDPALLRLKSAGEESRVLLTPIGDVPRSFATLRGVYPEQQRRAQDDAVIHCLDLFSGSGCIGIAVLKHIPQAEVDFADIDKNCLKQIKINLKLNKISPLRYRIFQTNIFNSILKTTRLRFELRSHDAKAMATARETNKLKTYNYIFANPPYIALKNKTKLQKSVLKYEPCQALFSKQNGLYFIDQTLRQAKKYLRPNGQLFLEFSPEQKNAITVLLKKYQYAKWRFNEDQFNRWRWLNTSK